MVDRHDLGRVVVVGEARRPAPSGIGGIAACGQGENAEPECQPCASYLHGASPENRSLLSALSARLCVTCTTPNRAVLVRPLTLSRPRAHEDVEVDGWRGRDVAREVQLLSPAVRENERKEIPDRGVDWGAEVIMHVFSPGNPDVTLPGNACRTIRGEE